MKKRRTIVVFTVALLAYFNGLAQSVSLSGKNLSLKQVFSTIKTQTGYVVFYNRNLLSGTKRLSLTVQNKPLREALDVVLKDQPINYIIQDKTIILTRKTAAGNAAPSATKAAADSLVGVNGFVRTDNGEFLPGVSIRYKNTVKGTVSDGFGAFKLSGASENTVIEFSMIGYQPLEFAVIKLGERFQLVTTSKVSFTTDNAATPGSIFLTLDMKKSTSVLDETQVIAYGKTSRRFSTGSIGTVTAEEIQKQPVMNVLQALEGRIPGVVVTPQSGNSASPIKVEIRGRGSLNPNALSEPLYVIDGIPQGVLNVGVYTKQADVNQGPVQAGGTNTNGESPLLYLNPRDIESVDVLKDADATAIYGARGANGVVIITTKRSKPGPTRFNINIGRGITTIPKKLDLMSTEEYLAVRREAFRNDGITPDIYNAPDLMLWDQQRYTDWQKLFFSPGKVLTVDAGVNGGMAQTNYGLSASYQSQEELMNQGGKTQRGSFYGNVTHTSLDQKFQFNFSSRLSLTGVDAVSQGNYIYTPPNAPDIYNEKGEFNFAPYRGLYGSNFPFGGLKISSESKTNTINTGLRLSYQLIKGLSLSVNGGYNFTSNDNARYTPSASSDPLFGSMSQAFYGKSSNHNWIIEPRAEYNAFIGTKGNLLVQFGGSLQDVKSEGLTVLGMLFPNDNLLKSPNNAALSQVTEGSGQYKYAAAFAIVNYRWDNKYILSLNGRRDGSSKFGPGKQFGNFGSVALSWIASEEKWMKSVLPSWWTFIKFRGSYGITGSDGIDDYEFLTRWSSAVSPANPAAIYSYNGVPGFSLSNPVNQDFGWQSTTKMDVAANLGFLNDRIDVEVDYYRNRSGNQLTMVSTPEYTGFGSVRANWPAVVQNSGLEISARGKILETKDWFLSANFSIGFNKNILTDYPGLESSAYANRYVIGQSLNMRYLFHYIGIDPATGDYLLEDYNKDGAVSYYQSVIPKSPADDRYIVYDLNPDYIGGFGVQAGYKGFALSGQFTFVKKLAEDPYYSLQLGHMQNAYLPKEIADDHWQYPGDNARYPKYTTQPLNHSRRDMDRFYADASYLKMNNLALSYDLPEKYLDRIKVKSCRFSLSAQNVFTITSYRGMDPEVATGFIPVTRTVAGSLSFTF